MPRFKIDEEAFDRLAEILKKHALGEIEYQEGDTKIRIVAATKHEFFENRVSAVQCTDTIQASVEKTNHGENADDYTKHPGAITSPIVGTCYLSPEPGAKNFVSVDDTVQEGQPVLIIEAMKVINLIKAPKSGKIVHIAVSDAEPVEFGQLLFVVE
jgi:acetyl-CoA carboxylase biotin carboxyl carrier protein